MGTGRRLPWGHGGPSAQGPGDQEPPWGEPQGVWVMPWPPSSRADLVAAEGEVVLGALLGVRAGHQAVVPQAGHPAPGTGGAGPLHPHAQEGRVEVPEDNLLHLRDRGPQTLHRHRPRHRHLPPPPPATAPAPASPPPYRHPRSPPTPVPAPESPHLPLLGPAPASPLRYRHPQRHPPPMSVLALASLPPAPSIPGPAPPPASRPAPVRALPLATPRHRHPPRTPAPPPAPPPHTGTVAAPSIPHSRAGAGIGIPLGTLPGPSPVYSPHTGTAPGRTHVGGGSAGEAEVDDGDAGPRRLGPPAQLEYGGGAGGAGQRGPARPRPRPRRSRHGGAARPPSLGGARLCAVTSGAAPTGSGNPR